MMNRGHGKLLYLLLLVLSSLQLIRSDYLESPAGRHAVGVHEEDFEAPEKEKEDSLNNRNNSDEEDEFDGPDYSYSHSVFDRGLNIGDYLNEYVVEREGSIEELQHRLEMGQLVLIPEAFDPDFADAMYAELLATPFALENLSGEDGYSFKVHTASNVSQHSPFLLQTHRIFSSLESRMFLTEFTDYDCMGEVGLEANYHAPGDYESPHTSDSGQNNIGFMWMLAKDWLPEWGGALYWCPETPEHSYVHASYNTLILFKIAPAAKHMVTMVSKHAKSKRLSYNGVWTGNWYPEPEDDLEDLLENHSFQLTRRQFEEIESMVQNGELEPSRQAGVEELLEAEYANRYPRPKHIFEIDANHVGSNS